MKKVLLAIITVMLLVFCCVSCNSSYACIECGKKYAAQDNYCSNCGAAVNHNITPSMEEYFNFKLIEQLIVYIEAKKIRKEN